MQFWPTNLKDWVDVVSTVLTTLFAIGAGCWALWQYLEGTRLKAAETLLKVEEEFRNILPTYAEIEDVPSYQRAVLPVLVAEAAGKLDANGLKKLAEIDRCLRFLYLCSLLNKTLGVDRVVGLKDGAIYSAYYYYIGILLPQEDQKRPDLLAYTDKYYRTLTAWFHENEAELRQIRADR